MMAENQEIHLDETTVYNRELAEESLRIEPMKNKLCEMLNNEWTTLLEWIQCMCVVTFDLNLGQALEYVYPPESLCNEQEITNICYLAFPDSNSGCMGDTKFHMRLRRIFNDNDTKLKKQFRVFNNECPAILKVDDAHFWGFVYFRQKRDANIQRGYFQKSFIIITRLPFFNLFYELLNYIAPMYFHKGEVVLREACAQINSCWPPLQVGITQNLPLFENLYQVRIPKASSTRKSSLKSDHHNCNASTDVIHVNNSKLVKSIASVNELDLFHSLAFIMEHLYTLWELVLIAEPIVVIGASPADCSHMVQTLVALIAPLEYCAEVRPYFTIHDSEFKEFTHECSKGPPPLILGVTNPFFVKLLKDWPHLVYMQKHQQLFFKEAPGSNYVGKASQNNSGSLRMNNTNQNSTVSGITSEGYSPGIYTKYKPFLKKDKALIKKVLLGIKMQRPEHVQTALLRRHLLELTQSFMIPLERYMASLMPLQKDISPFKSAPNASTFKLDDFIATLELSGPHLTSPLKGDWKGLYRRFFHSPNFRGWYTERYKELQLTLQDIQLQALSEVNLKAWAEGKQEVEIIDMILKLKQKLNMYTDDKLTSVNRNCYSKSKTANQIRAQIDCMKEFLPHDLKKVINI